MRKINNLIKAIRYRVKQKKNQKRKIKIKKYQYPTK